MSVKGEIGYMCLNISIIWDPSLEHVQVTWMEDGLGYASQFHGGAGLTRIQENVNSQFRVWALPGSLIL